MINILDKEKNQLNINLNYKVMDTGADRDLELQVLDDNIVWRRVGDVIWRVLLPLSAIRRVELSEEDLLYIVSKVLESVSIESISGLQDALDSKIEFSGDVESNSILSVNEEGCAECSGISKDSLITTKNIVTYIEANKESLKGDPGTDGITPHIGDNGHWYIGDEDTGVLASALNKNLIMKSAFEAEAYAEAQDNNLSIYVTEFFDDVSGMDLTDTTTAQVVEQYYDSENMLLAYNNAEQMSIRTNSVTLDNEPQYFWIRVDWEGSGNLQIDIEFVGAKTYSNWTNGACKYLILGQRSNTIGATLRLQGEVTLKNIAWGVR